MRVPGRRDWPLSAHRTVLSALTAAGFTAVLLVIPAGTGASGTSDRLASESSGPTLPPGGQSGSNRPFGGVAAIGALFIEHSGRLVQHFCTASVVDSPAGDLAVSAAHCFDKGISSVVFVPGYNNGATPYGVWRVAKVYTPQAWRAMEDPDDDVAFARLAPARDGVPVENVTGAERLGTDWASRTYVQVIGYPNGMSQPVWCANWTDGFSPTQLQFNCGGYTFGTSGGPFLTAVSGPADEGTVIGVIGGYQRGGYTPDISYSVSFGPTVADLYRTAISDG